MSVKHRLYTLFHPKMGEIWCLHRVIPERSIFKSNRDLQITPDFLEQLICEKESQGFRFVDMDAFVAAANGERKGRKLINISFDDGFADVFVQAYPILQRHNIPFTLYVSTDMPDGKADLWWYQLEQMANGDKEWFESIMKEVYARREHFASSMHEITSSAKDEKLCRQLALSWEQIRAMVTEGLCTVGSHGVSHSAFPLMSEEQACRELMVSKQRLEEMLDVEVRHFSYPHSLCDETTHQWVWYAGYGTAVVGFGGATRRKKGCALFYRNYIVQP